MFTIEQVKAELEELSGMVQDEFNIPVRVNGRLTRTLGRVMSKGSDLMGWTPEYMEFSKQFLESASENDILETIKHEWCHYYITKTTRESHGHDYAFQSLCDRVSCTHSRPSTKVTYNKPAEELSKYTVYCKHCGDRLVAQYSRMNKTLKQLPLCTCKHCGTSTLYYKQNW